MYRVTRRCYLALIAGRVRVSNPFLESGNEPSSPSSTPFPFQSVSKGGTRYWVLQTLPPRCISRGIHGPLAPISLHFAGSPRFSRKYHVSAAKKKSPYSYTDCYIEDILFWPRQGRLFWIVAVRPCARFLHLASARA